MKNLYPSFSHALCGLKTVFKHEKNFQILVTLSLIVILFAAILKITTTEFLILIIVITITLTLEIINSVVERFLDIVKPRMHGYVKEIKDIVAGGVLLSAIASLVVGTLIFLPYIVYIFIGIF